MTSEDQYQLGLQGYLHLKCHQHLTCEAAAPIVERLPLMLKLSAQAHLHRSYEIARQLTEQVECSFSDYLVLEGEPLSQLYLRLEELLDSACSDEMEPWSSEELSENFENLLGLVVPVGPQH